MDVPSTSHTGPDDLEDGALAIYTEMAWMEKKLDHERGLDHLARNKVPVIQYLPPYFKDENMMCPPQNEEAKHKLQYTTFDPLTKEDKKWQWRKIAEILPRHSSTAIYERYHSLLSAKMRLCSARLIGYPTEYRSAINRSVHKARRDVFKGTRSAATLRYKWLNEQCPRWNSGPWTKEELGKLKELREDPSFTSWAVVAKKLQTQRSPYQCFERYRSDMYRAAKDWTKEEDDRLIALVKSDDRQWSSSVGQRLDKHE
ncbi:hypothetical protein OSTOST_03919 [Ostertagia ostertagi]